MDSHTQTAAIILAAGTSSRMGQAGNKLLLPLANRAVLAHVLQAVHGSQARPIILVLGHQAEEVQLRLQPELRELAPTVVVNAEYAQGQSSSLKSGLRTLLQMQRNPDLGAVIFVLGDQPLVSSMLIDQLITLREQTGQQIALPCYRGQRGNPVVFSLELAPALLQSNGDEGGRRLIKQYAHSSATLEVDAPGANLDVDTWEAYQQVRAAWPKQT